MSGQVRLILTLHNHQPIGNFDGVFADACADSYLPFLELLDEFPEIAVVIHNSGSLFEWLVQHRPEVVDRLRKVVGRGQVEILGGPYYEPILSCLPRRDRIGQIRAYRKELESTLNTRVRGMWVPERVWEQAFASDLADAGMEYTLLDDTHFRMSGLPPEALHGYYLTENDGKLLKVFAGSERLRYLIPYAAPHEVIQHCRHIADHTHNAVLVFGDDGEKFGVWPGTKEHVFHNGWLRRFFQALRENLSWLKVTTMAEAVDHVSPLGRSYLPDASYREMTEWALPAAKQLEHHGLRHQLELYSDWPKLQQYWRAGSWRNFLVKYPEANEMYCRMLDVSQRVAEADVATRGREKPAALAAARKLLYQSQCNCPYWHGAFGGLYLPHLRNAIYSRLIQADTLLDKVQGRNGSYVRIDAADFNRDARKEVRIATDRLIAWLAPSRGGHLYELDLRSISTNMLATLDRRFEPYHDRIVHAVRTGQVSDTGGGVDPNGMVRFKQPGLEQKLKYDQWSRKSLVDHFLQPGLSHQAYAEGQGHVGDFHEGVYQAALRKAPGWVETRMTRKGNLGPYPIRLTKTVRAETVNSGELTIRYELEQLPVGLPIHFGVEFNFAAMPGGASDRYYYDDCGRTLGQLDASLELEATPRLGLVDEWLGLDAALDFSEPARLWTQPIQTVSQSESGFELVHQSCSVTPHWEFAVPEDGRWQVTITLSLDTSAAQAKQLAELREPVCC